jgi:beta-1,4-N-acetylglucosaminyltransferase
MKMKLCKKLLKKNKILAISSGGGHLTELLISLENINKNDVIFVVNKTGHTKKTLQNYKHYFVIDPHISVFKYILNFLQSFFIFFREKPKYIISTGAGIAIPMILIGKFCGSKIIFIETGARIFNPSRTGKFIYKYADLFIIQHESLKKEYPNAKIGRLL